MILTGCKLVKEVRQMWVSKKQQKELRGLLRLFQKQFV